MKAMFSLATASLIGTALSLHGAMLPGTEFKDFPANPEKHVVTIKREADTDTGKKMIQAAESAQPDTGKWWYVKDGEDVLVMGFKTPYALTADTLKYYSDQIKRYQETAWKGRVNEPSSKLDYTATVARHETFTLADKEYKNVYVVTMKMAFQTSLTDEAFGGTGFQKQRTVVLDAAGKVQAISGDKGEDFAMWMM